jgi:hypothetical protein
MCLRCSKIMQAMREQFVCQCQLSLLPRVHNADVALHRPWLLEPCSTPCVEDAVRCRHRHRAFMYGGCKDSPGVVRGRDDALGLAHEDGHCSYARERCSLVQG